MPVPSQVHYGFHSFPVVHWFCLFIYLWALIFPLLDCSEFGNFVITLIQWSYYCIVHIYAAIHFCVPFLRKSKSVLILITWFYLYWIMKRKWWFAISSISTKRRTTSCFWTQKKPRYLTMEIKIRLNNWITNVNTD